MLDEPARSPSRLTRAGPSAVHSCAHAIPPNGSWSDVAKSRAARTVGHRATTKRSSRRTSQWCQTPTATYAAMLVSPLASSTTPPTVFIGHEPSCRCVRRTHCHARSAASCRPVSRSAMAASTWFHTSVCPPTVHGIAPSGSWTASMARPESTSCSSVRSSGSIAGSRLVEVDDQALPDQRVERLLGPAGGPRRLHDVPDEHAVVRLRERVVVLLDTDGALDPPVRRVQTVRVVTAVVDEAGVDGLADQLRVGVDPDVTAGRVVVVVGEFPADDLGQPARDGESDRPAWAQHPDELA